MTVDASDGEPKGVVASALAAWLERPEVLADPYQADADGRVWTRAQDVLPGSRVIDQQPTVAAWEDLTWRAMPSWDPDEMDVLWLRPLGQPVEIPNPVEVYGSSPQLVPGSVVAPGGRTQADIDGERSDHAVLADFQQSVQLLVLTVRMHRQLAQDLLAELAALPPGRRRRVLATPAGRALLSLARRTGPPER